MSEVVQTAVLLHLPRSKKIDIEFENITYTVPNGRKAKKLILKGVSGKFKSGELTAIMGPSGAGKTSLLNILTGFQSTGMKGTINNLEKRSGSKQYKKESCYILQDDQLVPFFTISEIMNMSTNLKLGSSVSPKSKEFIVDDVLDTLGLTSCKHTRCGQLSGGQKKRLSIALELVNNPPVMFLDEPTTGLDSLSSLQCISTLKALARGGRTIVCTIHQPSAAIYEMFDYVYAMAEGLCIYKGSSTNTLSYLSGIGLNCPEYHNPADYLIEVASGEHGNFTGTLSQYAKQQNWRSTCITPRLNIQEEFATDENSNKPVQNSMVVTHNSPTEWAKFVVLLNRAFLQLYRDWTVTHLKFVLHTVIGIFIGMFYFDIGNDASKIIANFGYILVSCAYLCYTAIIPAVLKFPLELPVLKKEQFNNWYQLKTYYAAFMVADIPIQILFCTCFTTTSYFMSSQPCEWDRFIMFLTVCCLLTITAESVGIFLGTVANPINGTFLGAISLAFMISLAGFLVFLTHMSKPFYVLSYVSYLRYAVQGMVYSLYGHGRTTIPCPEDTLYCHYTTPSVFLNEIGMENVNYWFCVGILFAIIVFLRLLAYCTLKKRLSSN